MEKICVKCQEKFEASRKDKLFCSTKCKKAIEYLRTNVVLKKHCEYCKKEFETRKEKTRFCGSSCSNSACKKHDDVKLNCKECNKEFVKSYILRGREFCSRSCATINQNRIMFADNIIKQKISKTKKHQYSSGEVIHPFLDKNLTKEHKEQISKSRIEMGVAAGSNNPMFGKKHTTESREKISETRTKKILNGDYHSWFSKGKIFSHKMNKELFFQSSWEKQFLEKLDKDLEVLSFISTPFSIDYHLYGYKRKYIPDLLVNKKNKIYIIEIKPSAFLEADINKAKFKAAQEYCQEKGMIFEVWTEKSNPYLLTFIEELLKKE